MHPYSISRISLTIAAFVFFITPISVMSEEAGNKGELKVCDEREANKQRVEAYLKDMKTAQGCRDALKENMEPCFSNPEKVDFHELLSENKVQPGMRGQQEATTKLYGDTKQKFSGYAQTCLESKSKVDKACHEMYNGLKQALHDNTKTQTEASNELLTMSGVDPNRPAKMKEIQDIHQISLDLQEQMQHTNAAGAAGMRALDDQGRCYTVQALLYEQAESQSLGGETQTAMNEGQEGQNEIATDRQKEARAEISDENDMIVADRSKEKLIETTVGKGAERLSDAAAKIGLSPKVLEAAEAAGDEIKGPLSKTLSFAGKVSGVGFPLLSATNGDGLGTVTGAAGTLAEWTLSPTAAMRVSGIGLAANIILTPTELGHCDTMDRFDPVGAYNAGCAVTTFGGANANEMAMQSLSK